LPFLNTQLKMLFLQSNRVITLGKENNFLNPSFLRLIIIWIIRKLGVTPSSSRIIITNILGFLPLIKSMQSDHYHCGLIIGGSISELKLVFCLLPSSKHSWNTQKIIPLHLVLATFPLNFFSSFILVFLGSCPKIIISFPPDNNVYTLQSPNNNIKYIFRTIAVKWWDRYTYDDIITKIIGLCTYQFLASNQVFFKEKH
jgi:hypothetical protein